MLLCGIRGLIIGSEITRNSYYRPKKKSEMRVLTKAKELITLTHNYTTNWPNVDKFTLKDRARLTALGIYENLVTANETFIDFTMLNNLRRSIKHYESKRDKFPEESIQYLLLQLNLTTLKLTTATQLGDQVKARRGIQGAAFTRLSILDYYIQLAYDLKYINGKQEERWCDLLADVRNLLGAWIKADRKRYTY